MAVGERPDGAGKCLSVVHGDHIGRDGQVRVGDVDSVFPSCVCCDVLEEGAVDMVECELVAMFPSVSDG